MHNDDHGTSRRAFIKAAGAGALAVAASGLGAGSALAATAETSAPARKKRAKKSDHQGPYNIVFILTDQERYFKKYPKSAELHARQKMQDEGVSFENHYTCSNMCTASRSVIYTGQHIQKTGMFDNTNCPWQPDMSTDIPTLGDRLRELGYYTAYKGKVHWSRKVEPDDSGKLKTDAMEPYGFSDYNAKGDEYGHLLGGYTHDNTFAADAVDWLRSKGTELREQKQPFFLGVNLVNPHDIMYFDTDAPGKPVQNNGSLLNEIKPSPKNTLYEQTHPDLPLPKNLYQSFQEKGRPKAHYEYEKGWDAMLGKIPDKDQNWQRYRDYYMNCLKDVDTQIDNVLEEIDRLGMMENTIVVFTADHGEMAGNHHLRGKGPFSYEENIHLPLFVMHPAVEGGNTTKAVTSHVDLVPTILAMTGMDQSAVARAGKDLPGKNLADLLKNPQAAAPDAMRPGALYCYDMLMTVDADFIEKSAKIMAEGGGEAELKKQGVKPDLKKRGAMRTVFDGRYKFTRYFSPVEHNPPDKYDELVKYNELELYDLHNDPQEMHNLAAHLPQNKTLVMAMNAKLNELINAEVGKDDGVELPGYPDVNWAVTDFGH